MYKLIDWIRLLTFSGYTVEDAQTQIMESGTVNRKRHAKYFLLCLELLPPRLASHDSTRFVCFNLIFDLPYFMYFEPTFSLYALK